MDLPSERAMESLTTEAVNRSDYIKKFESYMLKGILNHNIILTIKITKCEKNLLCRNKCNVEIKKPIQMRTQSFTEQRSHHHHMLLAQILSREWGKPYGEKK